MTIPFFTPLVRALCLLFAMTVAAVPALADDKPVGTIAIDETQFMLFIGGNTGEGKLTYQGKDYHFEIEGVKLGGVGIHKVHLEGDVYSMKDISEFEGTYFVAEIGGTIGLGKGGYWFKNGNGVALHLFADAEGLALNLGVEGLDVRLKQ